MLYATPWQTVGPYLHIGMNWLTTDDLAGEGVAGQRIAIEGVLVDGMGAPVPDGLIEIWQANSQGRYAHPEDTRDAPEAGFRGFGRVPTDEAGCFRFRTIKPGRVPATDGRLQAPHIAVSVFARGILKRLATRIYFADEPSNGEDPVLALVPAARRPTLIAKQEGGPYRFNIVIQGEALGQGETVFFDL
ncbi:MAG: protocatechuate 3,4-dioxygenase subunit alpha [Gemmatimonadota bacterium]